MSENVSAAHTPAQTDLSDDSSTATITPPDEIAHLQRSVEEGRALLDSFEPGDLSVEEEAAFRAELEGNLAKLALASNLLEIAQDPNATAEDLQDVMSEAKHDTEKKGIIEISASELVDREQEILKGEAVAIVIRADTYADLQQEILTPLIQSNNFRLVRAEKFPHEGNAGGISSLHMDTFHGDAPDSKPHYKYALTAAQIEQGQALFIAGLGSRRTLGINREQYNDEARKLNSSKTVKGLLDRTSEKDRPRGVSHKEWHEQSRAVDGDMTAVTLSEGDVVIWPQGGEGSERPAWHAFYQIGHASKTDFVPRKSTSYHLAANPA